MKLLILIIFIVAASGINAMPPPPNAYYQQGIAFFSLPADLRKYILYLVASAPNNGTFDHAKGLDYSENLITAVNNVKNAMISNRAFKYFDDERFTAELIQLLFKRFPYVNKVLIASKLNTTGAGKWIATYIQTQFGLADAIHSFIHIAQFGGAKELEFMIKYVPQLINIINPASFDSQTKEVTPLMAAARQGNLRAVQQLLNAPGIKIHKKNSANRDALWFAEQSKSANKELVIKALQANGQ